MGRSARRLSEGAPGRGTAAGALLLHWLRESEMWPLGEEGVWFFFSWGFSLGCFFFFWVFKYSKTFRKNFFFWPFLF